MDCKIYAAVSGDVWIRRNGGAAGSGGFSHESEHDLAVMVRDFLENGSVGTDSWCSSDSDSGFSDLTLLAEKISYYKHSMDQYESDLLSVVRSLVQSVSEKDFQFVNTSSCNASCIRFLLVKLLRLAGYDAALCASKWQGCSKVPGGEYEYLDVVNHNNSGNSERLIIDLDFRSHFEIARAVASYDAILNSLPVVFVGTLTRLKQFLQVMVEAARISLKQNSMPLPPWRSLAYLQAKWQSPYQRQLNPEENPVYISCSSDHKQCNGHLRRLQSSLLSEIEGERLLKPMNTDNHRRMKLERWRHSSFRNL
ncbi:Protein of unknown function PDDEXK-like [Dillenia turbinata]|uniref:Uncharacterized protein n=1 Tax=Dillenia turbinata TaxID=194707 RepID=A0AAN8VG71_9MAGN